MRAISPHLRHLATLYRVIVVTGPRGMRAGVVPQHMGQA